MTVRRALVTGATGFLGSHLARRLTEDGVDVHAIVRPTSTLERLPRGTTIHEHDGSVADMVELVGRARPDVTFHLAARFVARHDTADVDALIDSNVRFGAQLLEGLRVAGKGRVVNAGTAWQHYGDADYEPASLYAATKQAFEDVLAHYVHTDGFRAVTLVIFDTWGPDDPRGKVLDLLIRSAGTERRLAMSPGDQRMHMVHVDDVVDAFVAAGARVAGERVLASDGLEADEHEADSADDGSTDGPVGTPGGFHERFRVDSDRAVSLKELAAAVEDAVGAELRIEWGGQPYREREIMEPWTGGRRLPGWRPRRSLEEELPEVVAEVRAR